MKLGETRGQRKAKFGVRRNAQLQTSRRRREEALIHLRFSYVNSQPLFGLSSSSFRAYNKMRNGRVARDLAVPQGARREFALRDSAQQKLWDSICKAWEAHILYGYSTDEQRGGTGKDRQPGGLFSGGRLTALLLSHRALWPCSFVAPCQPPARKTARPFLILL